MTAETNNVIPPSWTQFLDLNGLPLVAGQVYTYAADGLTPKVTYKDSSQTSPNANPIVLNSSGLAQIWGQGPYVFSVFDQNGNLITSGPTQDPAYALGVSAAMLPVIQASTLAAALALLGGASAGVGVVPYGTMVPFAGPNTPTGWALCYGQALLRSANPNLFAAIGTTWGAGDGSTTFNLPDMRGRVPAGVDAMGGTAANRLTSGSIGTNAILGAVGGDQNLQQHFHENTLTDPGHEHAIPEGFGYQPTNLGMNEIVGQASASTSNVGFTNNATTGITISIAENGAGTAQNVQPTAVVNYIIQTG